MAHINGMESHWAMLKRGHHGLYHHFSKNHLNRFVAELEGHHNRRPMDTATQMSFMARNAEGRQLRYGGLIEPTESRLSAGL